MKNIITFPVKQAPARQPMASDNEQFCETILMMDDSHSDYESMRQLIVACGGRQ